MTLKYPYSRSLRVMAPPTRPLEPATMIRQELVMTQPGTVDPASVIQHKLLTTRQIQVMLRHHVHQLGKRHARGPTKYSSGLRRIPFEVLHFGRTEKGRIDDYVVLPFQPEFRTGHVKE